MFMFSRYCKGIGVIFAEKGQGEFGHDGRQLSVLLVDTSLYDPESRIVDQLHAKL